MVDVARTKMRWRRSTDFVCSIRPITIRSWVWIGHAHRLQCRGDTPVNAAISGERIPQSSHPGRHRGGRCRRSLPRAIDSAPAQSKTCHIADFLTSSKLIGHAQKRLGAAQARPSFRPKTLARRHHQRGRPALLQRVTRRTGDGCRPRHLGNKGGGRLPVAGGGSSSCIDWVREIVEAFTRRPEPLVGSSGIR